MDLSGQQAPGSQIDSKHLLRNCPDILALALINGVSNNTAYVISLKESLTDTAWNRWMEFYATYTPPIWMMQRSFSSIQRHTTNAVNTNMTLGRQDRCNQFYKLAS